MLYNIYMYMYIDILKCTNTYRFKREIFHTGEKYNLLFLLLGSTYHTYCA